jgi:intracellular septation protein A
MTKPTAAHPATQSPAPNPVALHRSALLKALAPTVLGNLVLPYLIYIVAENNFGLSAVPALAWSAVPAVLTTLWTMLANRRVDVIGVVVLFSIAIGIGLSFATGNGRFAVAKDSILTLGVGLAMLGSLAASKPLLYHLVRSLRPDPARRDRLDRAWAAAPAFRSTIRRYTLVWSAGLLLAVALRLVLAFTLPIGTALWILQIAEPAIWIGLVVLTRKALKTELTGEFAAPATP